MIKTAIKNRKITLFLAVVVAILGIYQYYMLPKQESPDISPPYALITTIYPGASPEDVKELVTNELESKLVEISGYESMSSQSKNNVSIILFKLSQKANVEKSWEDLRDILSDIQKDLPEGCEAPAIRTDLDVAAGIIMSMSSNDYSYEELVSYGSTFEKEISRIDGIKSFDIVGEQKKEILITLDYNKLGQYPLSQEDIIKIITSQNIKIPSGSLNDTNGKLVVSTDNAYTSIDDIRNTIIYLSPDNGSVLRLKDIATVDYRYKDSNYKILHNGENAILLTCYFENNKNILITGKEVEKTINRLKKQLPPDLIFDYVLYQPDDVSQSINDFSLNLIEGIVIVIIVVLLGMGLRNALIVSTAIPMSILLTFTLMRLFHIPIHQVSISALIIALGMLVDNAIVVSDAIQVRIDKGQERLAACIKGVKEVSIPILTSTLTTIGAFIPLLILGSLAGQFIISLPQVIIISLASSYLMALFVTPAMAYIFFKPSNSVDREYSRIRSFFTWLLEKGMKHPIVTICTLLVVILGAYFVFTTLRISFFPDADTNMVYIDAYHEEVGDMEGTEALSKEIVTILKEQPEVTSYTETIGGPLPRFFYSLGVYSDSPDFAQIMMRVNLKASDRFISNEQFMNHVQTELNARLVSGEARVKLLEQAVPIGHPIRINVTGDDMDEIKQAVDRIKEICNSIEGIKNVSDDYSLKEYQYYINVDEGKASRLGISKYTIQKEISIALRGMESTKLMLDNTTYPIRITSNVDNIEDLKNLAVKSDITGQKSLLKHISSTDTIKKTTNIKAIDRDEAIVITADIKTGYSAVTIDETIEKALDGEDFPNVKITFSGERSTIGENFGQLGVSAIFAFAVIFIILLIQFKSFVQPFIIVLTIPLATIGSIVGLAVTGNDLSFTGLLGMISLMGIVVNNAIVLLDYINTERFHRSKDVSKACRTAVRKRFRPIILSSITTIMGLIPLILSGSELFVPLSVSLMFGLLFSTFLTLVFIPVIYHFIYGSRKSIG